MEQIKERFPVETNHISKTEFPKVYSNFYIWYYFNLYLNNPIKINRVPKSISLEYLDTKVKVNISTRFTEASHINTFILFEYEALNEFSKQYISNISLTVASVW